MKFITPRRLAALLVVLFIVLAVSMLIYLKYLFHFGPLQSSKEQFFRPEIANVWTSVEHVYDKFKVGQARWRKADYTSVGYPQTEADLLAMRGFVQSFLVERGRLPQTGSELNQPRKFSSIQTTKLNSYHNCRILVVGQETYVLNCDGWKNFTLETLKTILPNSPADTEKFYLVDGHVILYVPPIVGGE